MPSSQDDLISRQIRQKRDRLYNTGEKIMLRHGEHEWEAVSWQTFRNKFCPRPHSGKVTRNHIYCGKSATEWKLGERDWLDISMDYGGMYNG